MSTLWVREYSEMPVLGVRAAQVPVAREPGTDLASVTFSTSAQSAPFSASARYVALIADAAFHYVVGSNPTATTAALKVPANTLLYIGVTPGHRVAAINAA